MRRTIGFSFCAVLALLLCLTASEFAAGGQRQKDAQVGGNVLPDGFYIIPNAAPGSFSRPVHRAPPRWFCQCQWCGDHRPQPGRHCIADIDDRV